MTDRKRREQKSTRELRRQQRAKCCACGTQTAVSDGSKQQKSDGETRRQGRLKNGEREQSAKAEKKGNPNLNRHWSKAKRPNPTLKETGKRKRKACIDHRVGAKRAQRDAVAEHDNQELLKEGSKRWLLLSCETKPGVIVERRRQEPGPSTSTRKRRVQAQKTK